MTLLIIVLVVVAAVFLLLVSVGMRSRTIFNNPGSLSDAQIEATVDLTRRIMARTPPGSAAWARAAAKHKAAYDEQLRRRGETPFDNIELTGEAGS